MKQKMTFKIQMKGEKDRVKVMKTVAAAYGVVSVAIEGPEKDRVVVIGDEVDAVELANSLRKKVGYTSIMSVQKMKDKQKDDRNEDLCYPSSSSYGVRQHYPPPSCPLYYY